MSRSRTNSAFNPASRLGGGASVAKMSGLSSAPISSSSSLTSRTASTINNENALSANSSYQQTTRAKRLPTGAVRPVAPHLSTASIRNKPHVPSKSQIDQISNNVATPIESSATSPHAASSSSPLPANPLPQWAQCPAFSAAAIPLSLSPISLASGSSSFVSFPESSAMTPSSSLQQSLSSSSLSSPCITLDPSVKVVLRIRPPNKLESQPPANGSYPSQQYSSNSISASSPLASPAAGGSLPPTSSFSFISPNAVWTDSTLSTVTTSSSTTSNAIQNGRTNTASSSSSSNSAFFNHSNLLPPGNGIMGSLAAGHNVPTSSHNRFNFDLVLGPSNTQQDIFHNVARPMIDACLQGYNSCLFAYGQSGSGKTFTIQGGDTAPIPPTVETPAITTLHNNNSDEGIVPRCITYLYDRLNKTDALFQSSTSPQTSQAPLPQQQQLAEGIHLEGHQHPVTQFSWSICCSLLEVYNDKIFDLLDSSSSKTITLQDSGGQTIIHNASVVKTHTSLQCQQLFNFGMKNRKTASTGLNERSSRSHLVFLLYLTMTTVNTMGETIVHDSKLSIIDLAGSERVRKSGVLGNMEKLDEATHINKSLSHLSTVISKINYHNENRENRENRSGAAGATSNNNNNNNSSNSCGSNTNNSNNNNNNNRIDFVPYRDNVLTRLLRDSLGGNSMTCVIACVSPSALQESETLSTLRFAESARKVKNDIVLNEKTHMSRAGRANNAIYEAQITQLKEKQRSLQANVMSFQTQRDSLLQILTGLKTALDPMWVERYQQHVSRGCSSNTVDDEDDNDNTNSASELMASPQIVTTFQKYLDKVDLFTLLDQLQQQYAKSLSSSCSTDSDQITGGNEHQQQTAESTGSPSSGLLSNSLQSLVENVENGIVSVLRVEMKGLEEQFADLQGSYTEVYAEKEELREKIQTILTEKTHLQDEFDSLMKTFADAQELIANLQIDVQRLESIQIQHEEHIEQLEQRVDEQEQLITTQKRNEEQLRHELVTLQETHNQTCNALHIEEQTNQELREEIQAKDKQLKSHEKKLGQLAQAYKTSLATNNQLSTELDELQHLCTDLQADKIHLSEGIKSLQQEAHKVEKQHIHQISQLKEEANQREQNLAQEFNTALIRFQQSAKEKQQYQESQLEQAQIAHSDVVNRLTDLQQQFSNLTTQFENKSIQCDTLIKQVDELTQSNTQYIQIDSQQQQKITQQIQTIQQLEDANNMLTTQYNDLFDINLSLSSHNNEQQKIQMQALLRDRLTKRETELRDIKHAYDELRKKYTTQQHKKKTLAENVKYMSSIHNTTTHNNSMISRNNTTLANSSFHHDLQ